MDFDYQTVVDQKGDPQSVLISWDVFQQLCEQLNLSERPQDTSAQDVPDAPESEGSSATDLDDPVQYKDGGDYKPLSSLGVELPSNLKRREVATDLPREDEVKEAQEKVIKLGKRIR